MEKNKKLENNIVHDAYYLVSLFNDEGLPVTQLQVQKLMYLFEAYYMNKENKTLYECEYQAWPFGPVATPLYKHFKKYGKEEIKLTPEERKIAEKTSDIKKKYMHNLYKVFKDFKVFELVSFTHATGSPWESCWKEKPYSEIPKNMIKDWFSKYVKK